ncbi:sigma-70 family RNA polymerase sigma factor [Nonomuraea phyllanthi]|uniref:Sigma-70 family RNA polymerase sigma factor n=1 Tax=Nonomuraea phyllanthi TaxID=2219224 RepID=A0A5C4WL32_9ACTN|nr:sigma-70 family RNA polymerase sigma factor [Nonomuraea phyllanthi]KAB8194276.1 sigma-70 family RNA polymerase sigma factor [Nonomuraea phyllanthi]
MTASTAEAAAAAAASAVAAERAGMVASLIRLTGDWALAEDCVQDAVEKALRHWPEAGLPRSPAAWLTTAARNRALDVLRRRRTERAKLTERALLDDAARTDKNRDDRLSLIFTCCHPALPLDGRVALTLKTVAGLNTAQIADAFLVSESTMSQRLLRTKRKISHAAIPYRVPPADLLAERTDGVLAVLYLVFNAGYGQPEGRLADEALRLVRLLADLMPSSDEARGLLALIMFQQARRATRFDAAGDLVPMEEQDRARWDPVLTAEAHHELRRATRSGRPPGPYWLQARIAACHASAPSARATPWHAIVPLYDALLTAQPSPVAALNRAVAVGFRDGFAAGLDALDALDADALAGYHLLPAARADFLRRLGRTREARAAYEDALRLVAEDGPEARFLHRRLAALPISQGECT